MRIRIGSRGSDLALWQANFVKDQLENLGHEVEIQVIKTKGDKIQNLSFDKIEGKGFFTKEIEEALLSKEVDLAIHSHKDLETTPPEGLVIGAVSYREDPTDLMLIRKESFDGSKALGVKDGGIIGTSSARRQSLVRNMRPDAELKDLRGNVPTRINKLRDGNYDAIILASAGIKRLELDTSDLETITLNEQEFVPAPAQGVLALQIREGDNEIAAVMQELHHPNVQEEIHIEREILRRLEGGCQLPLGAHCKKTEGNFNLFLSIAGDKSGTAEIKEFNGSSSNELIEEALTFISSI